ncbi:hypothetical protein PIROE2DRAFT_5934, partial [Piromyces sp. E2]
MDKTDTSKIDIISFDDYIKISKDKNSFNSSNSEETLNNNNNLTENYIQENISQNNNNKESHNLNKTIKKNKNDTSKKESLNEKESKSIIENILKTDEPDNTENEIQSNESNAIINDIPEKINNLSYKSDLNLETKYSDDEYYSNSEDSEIIIGSSSYIEYNEDKNDDNYIILNENIPLNENNEIIINNNDIKEKIKLDSTYDTPEQNLKLSSKEKSDFSLYEPQEISVYNEIPKINDLSKNQKLSIEKNKTEESKENNKLLNKTDNCIIKENLIITNTFSKTKEAINSNNILQEQKVDNSGHSTEKFVESSINKSIDKNKKIIERNIKENIKSNMDNKVETVFDTISSTIKEKKRLSHSPKESMNKLKIIKNSNEITINKQEDKKNKIKVDSTSTIKINEDNLLVSKSFDNKKPHDKELIINKNVEISLLENSIKKKQNINEVTDNMEVDNQTGISGIKIYPKPIIESVNKMEIDFNPLIESTQKMDIDNQNSKEKEKMEIKDLVEDVKGGNIIINQKANNKEENQLIKNKNNDNNKNKNINAKVDQKEKTITKIEITKKLIHNKNNSDISKFNEIKKLNVDNQLNKNEFNKNEEKSIEKPDKIFSHQLLKDGNKKDNL